MLSLNMFEIRRVYTTSLDIEFYCVTFKNSLALLAATLNDRELFPTFRVFIIEKAVKTNGNLLCFANLPLKYVCAVKMMGYYFHQPTGL